MSGIHETATRIACAMAPSMAPKGATTEEYARRCVDLAIEIRAAMRRDIVYGPNETRIGRWWVEDNGQFWAGVAWALDVTGPFADADACVTLVTRLHEDRLHAAAGTVRPT